MSKANMKFTKILMVGGITLTMIKTLKTWKCRFFANFTRCILKSFLNHHAIIQLPIWSRYLYYIADFPSIPSNNWISQEHFWQRIDGNGILLQQLFYHFMGAKFML